MSKYVDAYDKIFIHMGSSSNHCYCMSFEKNKNLALQIYL